MDLVLMADLRLGAPDEEARRAAAAAWVAQTRPDAVVLAGGTLVDDLLSPSAVDGVRDAIAGWGVPVYAIGGGRDPVGPGCLLRALAGDGVVVAEAPLALEGLTLVPLPVCVQEPWQPVVEAPEVEGPALAVGWGGPVGPEGGGPDRVVALEAWSAAGPRHVALGGRSAPGTIEARWLVLDGQAWQDTPLPAPDLAVSRSPAPREDAAPGPPSEGLLQRAHETLAGDRAAQRVLAEAIAAVEGA